MGVKLPFYPEFSKELKPYSASSLLYFFIIKESKKNYEAVKNLSFEGSTKWFCNTLKLSDTAIRYSLGELSQKGFIGRQYLDPKDHYRKDRCRINTRYIPLRLPRNLRDKYNEGDGVMDKEHPLNQNLKEDADHIECKTFLEYLSANRIELSCNMKWIPDPDDPHSWSGIASWNFVKKEVV